MHITTGVQDPNQGPTMEKGPLTRKGPFSITND